MRPQPVDTRAPDSHVLLEVPARAAEIGELRRQAAALAAQAGLGADRCAEIALAVGEACANVVTHAYLDAPEPGSIQLRATVTADGLRVEVADRGRGMVPRTDSPGLGLGLPLIATLATSVEFGAGPDGGTEIRMLFAADDAAGSSWAPAS